MLEFLFKVDVSKALDVNGITRADRRARRRYLFRAAAFTRIEIIKQLKFRRTPSSPGNPPHVHQRGKGGLRLVRFLVNVDAGTALVGPVKLGSASAPVPGVLESGGVSNNSRIAPRPFVGPAFNKVKPKLSQIYAEEFSYTGIR